MKSKVMLCCLFLLLPSCKNNELEADLGIPDAEVLPDTSIAPGTEAGLPLGDAAPKDTSTPKKDSTKPSGPDFTSPMPPFSAPVLTTVAAIQYSEGMANLVKPACTSAAAPDVCALKELVIQARQQGANIIVMPEGASGQKYQEPLPTVGENPGQDQSGKWDNLYVIRTYSYLAKQIGVYLIINIQTYEGTGGKKVYNTNIAFDATGTIVDVHNKFNLFGNEVGTITPGSEVTVFDTPLGKTGQLICADIYGSTALRGKLANTLKARVVLVSAHWFGASPIPSNFQPYAKEWGVYAVFSNNLGPGIGGAIVKPDGTLIASTTSSKPSVLIGTIPLP